MKLAQRTVQRATPARSRSVSVCAKQQSVSGAAAKVAAVSAAVLMTAAPAFAGVILEQPQLKKVFQSDGTPAAASSSAPKAAKAAPAKAKRETAESTSEGGVAPQLLALPAALVFVGGGAFALSNIDPNFNEFMRTAAVKDSAEIGAGYEPAIKSGALVAGRAKKAGTTKVKKAAKAASGGGSPFGGLGGLFNKN